MAEESFIHKIVRPVTKRIQGMRDTDGQRSTLETFEGQTSTEAAKESKNIKYEMFQLQRTQPPKVNAATIILIIGFTSFFSIFLNTEASVIEVIQSQPPDSINGLLYLTPFMLAGLLLTIQSYYYLPLTGWFLGGFLAALLVGKEGARGPIFSVRLIYRTYMPIFSVVFVMTIIFSNSVSEIFSIFQPNVAISTHYVGMLLLYFPTLLLILSIPLMLLAIIGYQVGQMVAR